MSSERADEAGFERLLRYIEDEVGFETGFYNDAYLDRRITARMRRTDVDSYPAYRRLLEREDGEHEELLDSLSINVTSFFRNPEAWEGIRDVLRTVTDDRRRVRVWSAPSSDGREPYSIAMLALDDSGIDARRLEILGTDINPDILDVAREGRYEASRTTDIEEELAPLEDYERYIDRDGDRFEVRDRVREMVSFEQHDLIRGAPKTGFDVMLCRNLLIYIDASYKRPIFETIRGSIREGGYLAIGMTETIPQEAREAFEPVDKHLRIFRRT